MDPASLQQFSPLLATHAHALASENMDLQVVGCMDWTRLRNKIETIFLFFFILEIFKIRRSLYAHFNFTNLRINTDVLSPMLTLLFTDTDNARILKSCFCFSGSTWALQWGNLTSDILAVPGVLGAEGMQGRGSFSLHSGWHDARQSAHTRIIITYVSCYIRF